MPKIRLLVIDSSEIFREGLTHLLQSNSNIDVVSVSNTVSQAVKAARQHKPDVVLTDIEHSAASSTGLISHIKKAVPDTHIIIFTHSRSPVDFFLAVNAGAISYISKDSSFESLVRTIALAAEGKLIVDSAVAETVIGAFESLDHHRHKARPERITLLTEQEKRVLTLIAQDASNKEIARAMFLSENTVKIHVRNILLKLEAHDRLEATVCAIEQGLSYSVDGTGAEQP